MSATPPDAALAAAPAAPDAVPAEAARPRVALSLLTSLCAHLAALTILALCIRAPEPHDDTPSLQASQEDAALASSAATDAIEVSEEPLVGDVLLEGLGLPLSRTATALPAPQAAPRIEVIPDRLGVAAAPERQLIESVSAAPLKVLGGRDEASRGRLVRERGGTLESEAAVDAGLAWIAAHQLPNGSWSFDHRTGPCQGRCGDPGELTSAPLGATALALLPMLGAGHTHHGGKYQPNVAAGLQFLIGNMRNGSLMDGGNMYSQGIATIALCEALAMTQDRELAAPAQAAVNWIVSAQDPAGGGWRYAPRMPGDTSVTGWQLMALKSGHLSYLAIPPQTVAGCNHFLDTVATEQGSAYGYTSPGAGAGTTAVGLLCRMYLGWEHELPPLRQGVERIAALGPSPTNMYYNYYATQVLHHYDDSALWTAWNARMRPQLLTNQQHEGHEAGSFFFGEGHDVKTGGRLYMTAMSVMTLEVYYRYLPLYKRGAVLDSFALELGEPPLENDKPEGKTRARRPARQGP